MREIEFRGICISTGEWVYGYYYEDSVVSTKPRHYILTEGDTCLDPIGVKPETVGQFTGLYDNTKWEDLTEEEHKKWGRQSYINASWKGRRVFGGDICNAIVMENGVRENGIIGMYSLSWVIDMSRFYPLCREGWCELLSRAKDTKIIGSIHKNPNISTPSIRSSQTWRRIL